MMEDGDLYDEADYRPAMSGEPLSPERNVATPESRRTSDNNQNDNSPSSPIAERPLDPLEEAEAAAAAAEVAVMEGPHNTSRQRGGRDPTADRALMGATGDGGEDVIEAHQATDESGELVRGAFEEFLQN